MLGALGVASYLGYLSYRVFEDSLLFPFALTLLGLAVVGLGIWWQKHEAALHVAQRVLERGVALGMKVHVVAALDFQRDVVAQRAEQLAGKAHREPGHAGRFSTHLCALLDDGDLGGRQGRIEVEETRGADQLAIVEVLHLHPVDRPVERGFGQRIEAAAASVPELTRSVATATVLRDESLQVHPAPGWSEAVARDACAFALALVLVPLAAGALWPVAGVMLPPVAASAAMALSSVFLTAPAIRLRENSSSARARSTFLPRIRAATRFSFWPEPRSMRSVALASLSLRARGVLGLPMVTSSWPSCRPSDRNRYGSERTRQTCGRSCLR